MPTQLSLSSLDTLSGDVAKPRYERDDLNAGIVHIGVGNFHRAHMALYLHELFDAGVDHDWALIGAGVRDADNIMRSDLKEQDYLTTLIEMEPGNDRAKITGPMIDFIEVKPGNGPLIEAMSAPNIRIVSLTVTEGGYYINPAIGKFDPDHPDMQHDALNPEQPHSAFGAMIAALRHRRDNDIAPFTIMSCDNLPENGDVTRDTLLGLAKAQDPDFANWIAQNVTFPNSMVDRITPATSDVERNLVRDRYDIIDQRPVTCEPFRQWVLEDKFCNGRPQFERVGVTVTPDVVPYETMKIRILNGGHAAMAYPSAMLDVHYVHDAAIHSLVRAYLDKLERTEIIPIVPPVPDTDLNDYYAKVCERLENPGVRDTIPRLCFDGSNRQPKFIIPSIADRLAQGLDVRGLALSSAMWCRYCAGTTDSGVTIAPNDPNWDDLTEVAARAKSDPMAWLGMTHIYGDTAKNQSFAEHFANALDSLWTNGTAATLEDYLAE